LPCFPSVTPGVLVMFDDVSTAALTGLQYMIDNSINGTVYAISDRIGTEGYLTAENYATLDAANIVVGNHTKTHNDLTGMTREAQALQFVNCKNALDALGLTRASDFVAYPFGAFNADTLLAMADAGLKDGRGNPFPLYTQQTFLPKITPLYKVPWFDVTYTSTVEAVKGWINDAVVTGSNLCLVWHKLVAESPIAYEWLQSDFEEIMDYIIAQGICTKTILDAYNERF